MSKAEIKMGVEAIKTEVAVLKRKKEALTKTFNNVKTWADTQSKLDKMNWLLNEFTKYNQRLDVLHARMTILEEKYKRMGAA